MMRNLDQDGYVVVDNVVSEEACTSLAASLPSISSSGTRTLLSLEPYRNLARHLRSGPLKAFLSNLVAVEGILFRKTLEHNWAVSPHRDAVLPVKGRGVWPPSGEKEGMLFARPPRQFMNRCVVVRVHLDGAPVEDISIVPGSHADELNYDRSQAEPVAVPKRGALIMRPTVVHSSCKLQSSQKRRVLHLVFAPKELPNDYAWYSTA